MMILEYGYAGIILALLVLTMLGGSILLKRFQKKWYPQKNVTIEEGIFIDTKRRAVVLCIHGQRFLYTTGPHNDHLIPLSHEASVSGTLAEESATKIITTEKRCA